MTYTPLPRTGPRSLASIASEIAVRWPEPYFAAVPFIEAMRHMTRVTDKYGRDDGDRIVLSFLDNATRWHGETARRIKAELREMLKNA